MDARDRSAEALLSWLPAINSNPHHYDFYTILRCVESGYNQTEKLSEGLKLKQDPVRLSQPPFLGFSGHGIDDFQLGDSQKPHHLSSYLFGLFGPRGPLPLHITEFIHQCVTQDKDPAPAAFFNLFHHRLLSFYYRAWANTEPLTQMDRPQQPGPIGDIISCLAGVPPGNVDSQTSNDWTPCYYVGQLSAQQVSAQGLCALLKHYFDCPFTIKRFVPQWVDVPEDEQLQLMPLRCASKPLGYGLCLGSRVRSAQQHLTLTASPRNRSQFTRLLPNAPAFAALTQLVRRYLGHTLSWTLQLTIPQEQCPPWQLGQEVRLGWTQRLPQPTTSPINKTISVQFNPDAIPLSA